MSALLIRGGRVVDPATSLDALRDLRLREGRVAAIGERLKLEDGEALLDVAGAIVAPGFVDMHVHLREPGFPQKETLETGTAAAVRGGFTTVACMPNTNPALDEPATLLNLMREVAQRAHCRVHPIGAITHRRQGLEPCDFPALAEAGAVAFSDDGDTVRDAGVLWDAALSARALQAPFISHCEDPQLKAVPDSPAIAEDVIVARDLLIAAATGKSWHIAHLTTRGALELVRSARARGARVTCEVTPHHLVFTEALVEELGPAATVNPPLRAQPDVAALRRGVRDGTIDAFASDHAPHTQAEKSGEDGPPPPGFSSLEIAVGAYADALPDLPMARFIALLSTNPARILGVDGGKLAVGETADVTIFADRDWVVDPAKFASKGKCTPFTGRRLPRKVLATIVGGEIRYRAAELQ